MIFILIKLNLKKENKNDPKVIKGQTVQYREGKVYNSQHD